MFCGIDLKQIDKKRGRVLIEAASAAGCFSAEAYCHYAGLGGFAEQSINRSIRKSHNL